MLLLDINSQNFQDNSINVHEPHTSCLILYFCFYLTLRARPTANITPHTTAPATRHLLMRCHVDIGCSTTCSIFHNLENVLVFAGDDVIAVGVGLASLEFSNIAIYDLYTMRKFRTIKCLELKLKKKRNRSMAAIH